MNKIEQLKNRLLRRASSTAPQLVGREMGVRFGNSRVRGSITRCSVKGIRCAGQSFAAQFEVYLKTKEGYEHGPFVVENFPRR